MELRHYESRRIIGHASEKQMTWPFDLRLESSPDYRVGTVERCTSEITLFWEPEDKASSLKLREPPVPYPQGTRSDVANAQ